MHYAYVFFFSIFMAYEYYTTLWVERWASADEIKKAYRKKAMECHPDRHAGDKEKEAEFKRVNEAYSTLSDPQKKSMYDQFGTPEGAGGGFGGFQWGFDVDIGDIFESFFGGGGGRGRSRADIGEDIEIRIKISLEDAIRGTSRLIEFRRRSTCESCHGNGAKWWIAIKTCEKCHGQGRVRQRMQTMFGVMEQTVACPDCSGTGQVISEKCGDCHGRGWQETSVKKDIEVPAGIENGMSLKMRGEWHMGRDGNGDLYLTFDIPEREAGLTRDGEHLHYEVHISPAEASLGTEKTIDIPVLGKKTLTIKSGTQYGTEILYKHEGMPSVQKKWSQWHLIIHLMIDIPTRLTDDQKKLYEALLQTEWGKKMKKWWLDGILWD